MEDNPVLLLVLLLDHNILRKDHVVLVTVKVNIKFQTAVTGERGCKARHDLTEGRHGLERLTRAGLVVDLCRDTSRDGYRRKRCEYLECLRRKTFVRMIEWNGKDDESKRNNVLDAIWPRVGAKKALCLG
jgi:hypothetical protein